MDNATFQAKMKEIHADLEAQEAASRAIVLKSYILSAISFGYRCCANGMPLHNAIELAKKEGVL